MDRCHTDSHPCTVAVLLGDKSSVSDVAFASKTAASKIVLLWQFQLYVNISFRVRMIYKLLVDHLKVRNFVTGVT